MNKIKAMMLGLMIGDGWISKTGNSGFSGNKESLEILKKDLIDTFGDIGKATIFTNKTESEKYNISGTTSKIYINYATRDHFIQLGAPTGNLVEVRYRIPEKIMNGSFDIKRNFISGLYCAEGYTPSMQVNDKTPRCLGLTLTKRYYLKENLYEIMDDISTILTELKITHEVKYKETFTCDKNIRADIIFSNEIENLQHQLSILDFRYCTYKQEESKFLKEYLNKKQETILILEEAYNEYINKDQSATVIANKYNLNRSQLYSWKRRKTGVRIPNSFPKYTDFKKTYCPR